jgi:hypothetical protein
MGRSETIQVREFAVRLREQCRAPKYGLSRVVRGLPRPDRAVISAATFLEFLGTDHGHRTDFFDHQA